MAGPTIGHAEVDVDFSGDKMPKQAKQIADKAGKSLSKELVKHSGDAGDASAEEFGGRFDRTIADKMRESGFTSSRAFTQSFRVDSKGIAERTAFELEGQIPDRMNAIGRMSGDQWSKAFVVDSDGIADRTSRELVPAFRNTGTKAIVAFGDGLSKGTDLTVLRNKIVEAQSTIVKDSRIGGNRAGTAYTGGFRDAVLRAAPRILNALRGIGGGGGGGGGALGKDFEDNGNAVGFRWAKGFGFGAFGGMDRTVALVLNLIASLAPQMAALGSGASAAAVGLLSSAIVGLGGALIALGGPLIAVVASLGFAVREYQALSMSVPKLRTALQDLSETVSEQSKEFGDVWAPALATAMDQVADAFEGRNFGAALGKAVAGITKAFGDITASPGFDAFMVALETTIPAAMQGFGEGLAGVTQGLLTLFAAAGPAVQQMGEAFAVWGQNFAVVMQQMNASGQLAAFFETARISLDAILGLLLPLSQALGNVFYAGTVAGNTMLGTLGALANDFLAWTESIEGQTALQEWFDNGVRIFDALLPVVGALSTALADMVTPETVQMVVDFFGSLTEFLPILGQILSVIGGLDLLNLVATAFLAIGQAIQPVLPILQGFADLIGQIPPEVISGIAVALGAMAVALGGLGPLAGPIGVITAVLGGLAMIDPSALATGISTAIETIVGLFTELVGKLPGLVGVIIPTIVANITANIPILIAGITTLVTQLGQALTTLLPILAQGLVHGIGSIATSITAMLPSLANALVVLIQDLAGMLPTLVGTLVDAGLALFTGLLTALSQILPMLLTAVIGMLPKIFSALIGMVPKILQAALTLFQGLITAITTIIPQIITSLLELLPQLITSLLSMLPTILETAINLFLSIVTALLTAIPQIIAAVIGLLPVIINALISMIPSLIETAITLFTTLVTGVVTMLPQLLVAIVGMLPPILSALGSLLPQILLAAVNLFLALVTGFDTVLPTLLDAIVEMVPEVVSALIELIPVLFEASISFFTAMVDAIPEILPELLAALTALGPEMFDALIDMVPQLVDAGEDLMQGLIDGIIDSTGKVADAVTQVAQDAWDSITGFFDMGSPSKLFHGLGENLMAGLTGGIAAGASGPLRAIDNLSAGLLDRTNLNPPTGALAANRSVGAGPQVHVHVPTDNPVLVANTVLDTLVTRWK